MKKRNLLGRLLLLAVLAGSSSGGLYSCRKASLEPPTPTAAPSPGEAVRLAFQAAGLAPALTQPFGDSARLDWEPNWRAAYTKKSAVGVTYTYVPLTPTLFATRTQRPVANFHLVGTRRFILAKHVGPAVAFSLATYTVATPTAASGRRQTLAEAATQPVAFASFSGSLTLRGLTSGERAIFAYQNGQLVSNKPAGPTAGQKASATSYFDCVTIYTCYWQALCPDGKGNTITSGTITQSIGSCTEPRYEACGTIVWGIGWNDIGFDTYAQCVQVDDPPMPDPTDPGSPGGGEAPTAPNTILNTNLQPCQTAVFNKLVNLSSMPVADGGLLAFVVNQFGGSNTNYNWTLQNGSLPPGTYGSTSQYNTQYHFVSTTFDASHWSNASDLSVARTMLHEAVHAYLLSYFANDPTLASAEYADLVAAYAAAGIANPNIPQHNFMAQDLLNDIAYGLQQYGSSQGYNLPAQYYTDMAWGRLESSSAFRALPWVDRNRISNLLQVEATGVDTHGNYQPQQGSSSGCQ